MSDDILERRKRETARILALYEREAHKYDREMRVFEKLLFGGGREWVCSQAEGDVLEIVVGTGRNLPFYGEGVRLTGVELSPAMLEIARGRARELGRDVDLRVGDGPEALRRWRPVVLLLGPRATLRPCHG